MGALTSGLHMYHMQLMAEWDASGGELNLLAVQFI